MSFAETVPAPTKVAATPAVSVEGVTKIFSTKELRAPTLKESLLDSLQYRRRTDIMHALDDVSFTLEAGKTLGLIGHNGAGKSTLLKLIAGITPPTRGRVHTGGTVMGLIELGAGFHPDLTGDENIRLQASIYGMSADAIEPLVEPILEYAGLMAFRSMPVCHYSSGMYVRLGFSIAVHTRPDVLLIDEVLSVGDLPFQEKSIAQISKMRDEGAALIYTTHSPEQTEQFCDQVLWMERGRIRMLDTPEAVLAAYQEDRMQNQFGRAQGPFIDHVTQVGLPGRFGTEEARIEHARVCDEDGKLCRTFAAGQTICVEVDYSAAPEIEAVDCCVAFDTAMNYETMYIFRAERNGILGRPVNGRGRFKLEIQAPPLLSGRFIMTLALTHPGDPYSHYSTLYKLFEVNIVPPKDWNAVAPLYMEPELEMLD